MTEEKEEMNEERFVWMEEHSYIKCKVEAAERQMTEE